MTKTVRQISYRLQSDGKAEVIRDAREVGEAYRASYGQAEAGANAASVAAERQEAKFRRMAEAARAAASAEASQARYNAAIGVDRSGAGSARESAAVFAAQADAMEDAERRARALRAIIDPLGAAQDRLNDELSEYDRLAKAGQISTMELAQAQKIARQRFEEQTIAIERNSRGLTRLQVASRLNLARQGADVAVTAAMGMNPAMIAIQQGPQILDALATSGLKARGSLLLLGGALTVAAGGAAVATVAWLDADKAATRLERITSGIGRTAGLTAREVEALAQAQAASAEISIKAAREQAATYLATGDVGEASLKRLLSIGKDYAAFMGVDATEATKQLGDAMGDPLKAGERLTDRFGLLTLKQLDQIEAAMKSGDQMRAQAILLDALDEAMKGHADKVDAATNAWQALSRWISNAATSFGEWLYVTREERIAQLEKQLAGRSITPRMGPTGPGTMPYQNVSADRAEAQRELDRLRAEERRDGEARQAASVRARRNQEAFRARERAEEASRGRRGSGDSARREAEQNAREAEQRRRREEDVRAQLDLEVARLTNQYDLVRQLEDENSIRRRTRELIDADVEAGQARRTAEQEQARITDARADAANREMGTMLRSAELEASRIDGMNALVAKYEREVELQDRIEKYLRLHLDLTTATNAAKSEQAIIDEARATAAERIAEAAARERRITLAQMAGRDDEYRRLSIEDRYARRAQQIEKDENLNIGAARDRARREINEEIAAEAQGARRAWIIDFVSDIRRSGIGDAIGEQLERATDRMLTKLIDQLLEIDWAKMFNQGTGAGGGGGFGSFLASMASAVFGGGRPVGQNAQGTDYWRGGLTWVGERGPELLDLPRGSRVTEHNRSMQLAVASAASAPAVVDLGGLTIKNYGSEPVTGRMKRGSNGGLELELEPLFKGMLGRAGKDGTLARAVGASPRPRKR